MSPVESVAVGHVMDNGAQATSMLEDAAPRHARGTTNRVWGGGGGPPRYKPFGVMWRVPRTYQSNTNSVQAAVSGNLSGIA